MKKIVFIVFILLLLPNYIFAEMVYIQNGKTVEGEIIENKEDYIVLKNDEGQYVINKKDIVYIEDSIKKQEVPKGAKEKLLSFWDKISRDNFAFIRKKVKHYHLVFFNYLDKNIIYKKISQRPAIVEYRKENRASYIMAVYMIILLLLGFCLQIIKGFLIMIYCKVFKIKEKFDL